MPYGGPTRRERDELVMQLLRELADLRGEVRSVGVKTDADLLKLAQEVRAMKSLVERWKTVLWVLTGLAGLLTWLEAQWQILSRFIQFLMGGKP